MISDLWHWDLHTNTMESLLTARQLEMEFNQTADEMQGMARQAY